MIVLHAAWSSTSWTHPLKGSGARPRVGGHEDGFGRHDSSRGFFERNSWYSLLKCTRIRTIFQALLRRYVITVAVGGGMMKGCQELQEDFVTSSGERRVGRLADAEQPKQKD